MQRVADDAGGGLELALSLRRVAEEFRDGAEMAQWEIGEKREVGCVRFGWSERNPRSLRHKRIVAKRVCGEIKVPLRDGESGAYARGCSPREMRPGV